MNLTAIRREVYQRCKLGASPANDVVQMVDGFINNRHRMILSAKGITKLRDIVVSFTTTANTAVYSLPANIGKVNYISDPNRNYWKLEQKDLAWVRQSGRLSALTGTPIVWVPLGIREVAQQPSAQTGLYVVSTGTDTGNVVVSYTTADGFQYAEEVTLNSTTAAQVGTSNTIVSAEGFKLLASANGTVSLKTAAIGGTTLSTIPPGFTSAQYQGVQLYPTPADAWTYQIDATRNIPDLVNAYDEPLLPLDFHQLVPLGARIDMYEYQEDYDRMTTAQGQYSAMLRRLVSELSGGADRVIVPGGGSTGFSSLGPNYPADQWPR